jgi:hypothetical protein
MGTARTEDGNPCQAAVFVRSIPYGAFGLNARFAQSNKFQSLLGFVHISIRDEYSPMQDSICISARMVVSSWCDLRSLIRHERDHAMKATRDKTCDVKMLRSNTLSYLNTFCRSHRTAEQITRYLRGNGFPGLSIGNVRPWLRVLLREKLVTSKRGAGYKITERGRSLTKDRGTRSDNQKSRGFTWNGDSRQLPLFPRYEEDCT